VSKKITIVKIFNVCDGYPRTGSDGVTNVDPNYFTAIASGIGCNIWSFGLRNWRRRGHDRILAG
jgi:hypothetical protein